MHLRYLTGITIGLALAACREPASPAASFIAGTNVQRATAASHETIDEAIPFSVPLYLDCLDEMVTWSGTVLYHYHRVVRPSGTIADVGEADLASGSTMVGPSGTWSGPAVKSRFNFVGDDAHYHERIAWTNAATGAEMIVRTAFHIVVTGNGDLKVVTNVDHSCTLD